MKATFEASKLICFRFDTRRKSVIFKTIQKSFAFKTSDVELGAILPSINVEGVKSQIYCVVY